MADVGGVACDMVHTIRVARPRQKLMTWTAPGVDGTSALKLGKSEGQWEFVLVLHAVDGDEIREWETAINALADGDPVTIVDDAGDSYGGCIISTVAGLTKAAAFGVKDTEGGPVDYAWRAELPISGAFADGGG